MKFKYEGLGIIDRYKDTTPVTIYWKFEVSENQSVFNEIVAETETVYEEGESRNVCLKGYERNKVIRDKCIVYYGYNCGVCNMSFEEVYEDIGKEFIHVHQKINKEDMYVDDITTAFNWNRCFLLSK